MITKIGQYQKEDINAALMNAHEMTEKAEDCILKLQAAFIYNTARPLKDCYEAIGDIKKTETQLTKKIRDIAVDYPSIKSYIPIPADLLIIGEKLGSLTGLIDKKIRENILFSDKAIKETVFLLQRAGEILWTASSLILARNIFTGIYIEQAALNFIVMADEYATMHEERLIEGVCLPVASALYINMLDAIKGIARQSKEIAGHLA